MTAGGKPGGKPNRTGGRRRRKANIDLDAWIRHAETDSHKPLRWHRFVIGVLLLSLVVPACLGLGFWQFSKYQNQTRDQQEFDYHAQRSPTALPRQEVKGSRIKYHHFIVSGTYEAAGQILLDEQTQPEGSGYHVITPLRLSGSRMRVLVNRGWVSTTNGHVIKPADYPPPVGKVRIKATAVVPSFGLYDLLAYIGIGQQEGKVWKRLSLDSFRERHPYPLQSVVLQLSADSPGGYQRDWPQPDESAEDHYTYAMLLFGGAGIAVALWFVLWWTRSEGAALVDT